MAGRKKLLEREVIPAWATFLRGLLQGRHARTLLAEAMLIAKQPTITVNELQRKLPMMSARVRKLTDRRNPSYPSAERTWMMAEALRRIGHLFCGGPLVLYAASHLPEFVSTMVLADLDADGKDLLLEVLDSIIEETVALPMKRNPVTKMSTYSKLRHLIPDSEDVRETREIWYPSVNHGTGEQDAIFERAWSAMRNGSPLPDDEDVDAAMLAASNDNAPLAKRRRVVISSLRRYFQRLERESSATALPSTS